MRSSARAAAPKEAKTPGVHHPTVDVSVVALWRCCVIGVVALRRVLPMLSLLLAPLPADLPRRISRPRDQIFWLPRCCWKFHRVALICQGDRLNRVPAARIFGVRLRREKSMRRLPARFTTCQGEVGVCASVLKPQIS